VRVGSRVSADATVSAHPARQGVARTRS
jgi:hypothetical protein